MPIRRFLAVVLIAALLGTQLPSPPEADASNTGVIVAVSIVGWFSIVVIATYLVRNSGGGFSQWSESPLVPDQRLLLHPQEPEKLRFGKDCPAGLADGSSPSLLCW